MKLSHLSALTALVLSLALTPVASAARPYYGGGRHTSSHGGSYGTSGASHKGGHYRSPSGSRQYGRHK